MKELLAGDIIEYLINKKNITPEKLTEGLSSQGDTESKKKPWNFITRHLRWKCINFIKLSLAAAQATWYNTR